MIFITCQDFQGDMLGCWWTWDIHLLFFIEIMYFGWSYWRVWNISPHRGVAWDITPWFSGICGGTWFSLRGGMSFGAMICHGWMAHLLILFILHASFLMDQLIRWWCLHLASHELSWYHGTYTFIWRPSHWLWYCKRYDSCSGKL